MTAENQKMKEYNNNISVLIYMAMYIEGICRITRREEILTTSKTSNEDDDDDSDHINA